jgi:hypothetical protein
VPALPGALINKVAKKPSVHFEELQAQTLLTARTRRTIYRNSIIYQTDPKNSTRGFPINKKQIKITNNRYKKD